MHGARSKLLSLLTILIAITALNIGNLNSYFIGDDFTLIHAVFDKKPAFFGKLFLSDYARQIYVGQFKDNWEDKGAGFIRPLGFIFHKIHFRLYGTRPFGYHLTNLVLHFLNCLLILTIIEFITRDKLLAFLVTLMFASHPVQSINVAWIACIDTLLGIFFYLLSFYLYIRYRSNNKKSNYVLSVIFFLLGLFSKESAIAFPFLLVGYDLMNAYLLPHREGGIRPAVMTLKSGLPVWLGYLGILAAYFWVRKIALGNFIGGYQGPGGFSLMTIAAAIANLKTYVRYALFASPFYGFNQKVPMGVGEILGLFGISAVIICPLIYNGLKNIRLSRLFTFGALWTVISFSLPLLSTIYVSPQYLSLPLVGIASLLIASIFSLYGRKVSLLISILLIMFYAAFQIRYNAHWACAGHITEHVVKTLDHHADAFQENDIIILVDIPERYKTAWAFYANWEHALLRPFTRSDLARRFYIRLAASSEKEISDGYMFQRFWSDYQEGRLINWDKVVWGEPIRLLKWEELKSRTRAGNGEHRFYSHMWFPAVSALLREQSVGKAYVFKWEEKTHTLEKVPGPFTVLP